MAKKVLSIVIGAEITKVCEISYKKNYKNKGIRVYKSISFPTPANTIEDGYIKDKNTFREQLRIQLKTAKIKSKKVIFSIASSKIANREVVIPLVRENRINDIIKTGASDYFPVDIKDYILSYIILEKKTSDRKEKLRAKKQEKEAAALAKKQAKQDKKEEKKNRKMNKKNSSEYISSAPTPKLLFEEEFETQETNPRDIARKEKSKKDAKSKKNIRLSVYAVPSGLVKNYYNFADMMGLELISIDYSGNSSYQMLKRQANEGTNVFVQLNEQDTVISILEDNVLVLQRTIGYGISTLTQTVMEQSYYHIEDEKAAMELLQSQNLLEPIAQKPVRPKPSEVDVLAAAALEEVAATVDYLRPVDEEYQARNNIIESLLFVTNSVSRMLDYYKNNHRNVNFKTIYLSGFGIRIKGIERLFSERIGISNKNLDRLATVSSKKKAQEYRLNPSEFMACIGSVIKPVDFVPVELVLKKQKVQAVLAATFLVLLSIGGSGVLCYVAYNDYAQAKVDYETVQNQLDLMPATSGIKSVYESTTLELEDLQKMEASTHNNEQIIEVMTALQQNLLTNSAIQSIQFSDSGVVMSIILSDNKYGANTLVAKLLTQMKTIDLFDDVQDSNMSVSESGEVSLTVACTYK